MNSMQEKWSYEKQLEAMTAKLNGKGLMLPLETEGNVEVMTIWPEPRNKQIRLTVEDEENKGRNHSTNKSDRINTHGTEEEVA